MSETNPRQVVHSVATACTKFGAVECSTFVMNHINSPVDYMIICSATSILQARGLSQNIEKWLHAHNIEVLSASGRHDTSGWIIIDCAFFFIHIMQPDIRAYYDLEHLWFQDTQQDTQSDQSDRP